LNVRLKIENFGSTSPAREGFQPARNNGTKANNPNGTKADNPNGSKAENHNGTKAGNPNGTMALNLHTHRSEGVNRSCWQEPIVLQDLIHFRHLLLRGFQLIGKVRGPLLQCFNHMSQYCKSNHCVKFNVQQCM
jgi:hypothetical protein